MREEFPETIAEARSEIRRLRPQVGKGGYSHNIIGLILVRIARDHGQEYANQLIRDCKLESLGWTVVIPAESQKMET